jgi:hypothetical protein
MDEFSATWLALREPADAAARSRRLTRLATANLPRGCAISVVDLGAGTGANARYLLEHLPRQQRWLLVDHDGALLEDALVRLSSWGLERGLEVETDAAGLVMRGHQIDCRLATRRADLSLGVPDEIVAGTNLVTASALLDLVSESWLRSLADSCRRHGSAALFALSYDGRVRCMPHDPSDQLIVGLVNRHQQQDKGFGLAVGPSAADTAVECFKRAGYQIKRERSDWTLGAPFAGLQHRLINLWADAALETAPAMPDLIEDWRRRRLAHAARGRSALFVGHQDVAAWIG